MPLQRPLLSVRRTEPEEGTHAAEHLYAIDRPVGESAGIGAHGGDVEKQEQQRLRQAYVAEFRRSLQAQLDNTVIVEPDGTRHKLTPKATHIQS